MQKDSDTAYNERRWPGAIALLAVAALHTALPDMVTVPFLPWWLLLVVVALLELPALVAHRKGYKGLPTQLGFAASTVVTLFLLASVVLLVVQAVHHKRDAAALLQSAVILWCANVIVFAGWYWRLDAGGPRGREREQGHEAGAFLFPQMNLDPKRLPAGHRHWTPKFVDYLFLAFNTSTAFSPTDTSILSRWAKGLVMLQSSLSLTLVAILIGRAVNAL